MRYTLFKEAGAVKTMHRLGLDVNIMLNFGEALLYDAKLHKVFGPTANTYAIFDETQRARLATIRRRIQLEKGL